MNHTAKSPKKRGKDSPRSKRPVSVLVLDLYARQRTALARTLRKLKFEAHVVASCREAIDKLESLLSTTNLACVLISAKQFFAERRILMSRLSSLLQTTENDKDGDTKNVPGVKPRKVVPVGVYTTQGQQPVLPASWAQSSHLFIWPCPDQALKQFLQRIICSHTGKQWVVRGLMTDDDRRTQINQDDSLKEIIQTFPPPKLNRRHTSVIPRPQSAFASVKSRRRTYRKSPLPRPKTSTGRRDRESSPESTKPIFRVVVGEKNPSPRGRRYRSLSYQERRTRLVYKQKSKSSSKASSSSATNPSEPSLEAKAQTEEKAPETKTDAVNEEKEGSNAAENPTIQLEKQSHHNSRRPSSAHPPKRRVLVTTPITTKKRLSSASSSRTATPLSPFTAQQAAKTQQMLVGGLGRVDAIETDASPGGDKVAKNLDKELDNSMREIIDFVEDEESEEIDESNEEQDTVASTLGDIGIVIGSTRVSSTSSRRMGKRAQGHSRNTWLRCASASVKRRMQAGRVSDPLSSKKTHKGFRTSPVRHLRKRQASHELKVQLPLYKSLLENENEPEQPRLLSYASKQPDDQKPHSPRVVRPSSARHTPYRQHSDNSNKKLPKGTLLVRSRPLSSPRIRKPLKSLRGRVSSARGRRRPQTSSMNALEAIGVTREIDRKKKPEPVSFVPDTNWKLEVAGDRYSCSQTGNHLWGERVCRICGILKDDEFIRQELATRAL